MKEHFKWQSSSVSHSLPLLLKLFAKTDDQLVDFIYTELHLESFPNPESRLQILSTAGDNMNSKSTSFVGLLAVLATLMTVALISPISNFKCVQTILLAVVAVGVIFCGSSLIFFDRLANLISERMFIETMFEKEKAAKPPARRR